MHGLGTESPKTWEAYGTPKEDETGASHAGKDRHEKKPPNVNWLSDEAMLPAVVPDARILSFNYDSSWYSEAPVTNLLELAETLLTALAYFREAASAAEELG